MKRAKAIAFLVALVAAALVGIWLGAKLFSPLDEKARRVLTGPGVVKEIQRLSELITVRHVILTMVEVRQPRAVFGEEVVGLKVRGHVEAGVKLDQVLPADVRIDEQQHTVEMTLPAPVILRCYIDDQHTEVWERTKPWFVRYDKSLDQLARQDALAAIKNDAINMGILEQARQNAESGLKEFLHAFGFADVTVRFRE